MKITCEDALLLLVDMQDKLYPHMAEKEMLKQKVLTLVQGLKALNLPLLTARQYPKGLGATLPELQPYFERFFDKTTFSCCGSEELLSKLRDFRKKYIIIAGIEAHVCVLQTVLDLQASGYIPVVITDAIASRHPFDYQMALKRMEQECILLATTESILFELCGSAENPAFKSISQLVK